MSDTLTALVAATVSADVAGKGNPSNMIDRLKACFREARDHWMAPSEYQAFMGGVAAALELTTDEADKDRLLRSARALGRLNAALNALQAGVPVDLESMAAEQREDDLLPLRKIWDESTKRAA